MRKWIIDSLVTVACLTACLPAGAQAIADAGDCTVISSDSLKIERLANQKYLRRLERHHRRWASLIPNKFSLQYAGDMGMLSAGIGWDYGRRNQWETHLFVGYLPKNHTPNAYWSFTLKELFIPWSIKLNDLFSIEPLYCTLFVNSILNSEFWTKEPDRYPQGYYGFSSKIRFHIGLGQKITIHIPTHRRFLADNISLYYSISTCDLYVRQKILSSSIPLKDIICLDVGLQYTIE